MKARNKELKAMEQAFISILNELYAEVDSCRPFLLQATREKTLRRKWELEFFKETAEQYVVQKARDFLDKKEFEYTALQQARDIINKTD